MKIMAGSDYGDSDSGSESGPGPAAAGHVVKIQRLRKKNDLNY